MLLCYVIDSGLSTSLLLLATLIIMFYILHYNILKLSRNPEEEEWPLLQVFKKCPRGGIVRARTCLVGRIGSGVRTGASFQKNAVGRVSKFHILSCAVDCAVVASKWTRHTVNSSHGEVVTQWSRHSEVVTLWHLLQSELVTEWTRHTVTRHSEVVTTLTRHKAHK